MTIMKTLEAHKDSHKEVMRFSLGSGVGLSSRSLLTLFVLQVVRAAEEAASTLAGSIHPEQCIKVLCPIVQTADYPINLAAIKMQTRAIERISKEPLHQLLPDIIPGLLQVLRRARQQALKRAHAIKSRCRRVFQPSAFKTLHSHTHIYCLVQN